MEESYIQADTDTYIILMSQYVSSLCHIFVPFELFTYLLSFICPFDSPFCDKYFVIRFEIEKKLREAKRKESQRQKVAQTASASVSQRSKDRRKVIEDKKDNKKMSALQDLKARREEKKKQGKACFHKKLMLSF